MFTLSPVNSKAPYMQHFKQAAPHAEYVYMSSQSHECAPCSEPSTAMLAAARELPN